MKNRLLEYYHGYIILYSWFIPPSIPCLYFFLIMWKTHRWCAYQDLINSLSFWIYNTMSTTNKVAYTSAYTSYNWTSVPYGKKGVYVDSKVRKGRLLMGMGLVFYAGRSAEWTYCCRLLYRSMSLFLQASSAAACRGHNRKTVLKTYSVAIANHITRTRICNMVPGRST